MNMIKQFHELTVTLIRLFENEQLQRDEKMAEAEKLLAKREGLLQQIKPPFSPQEKELGKQLITLNEKLEQLLEKEKSNIQRDRALLQKQKRTNKKYRDPYESLVTVEGGFYDKRK